MSCDCCKSTDKVEKLLEFLGISLCYKCDGSGRIQEVICQCCEVNNITCPECKGNEFIVDDYSILKSLIPVPDDADDENNIGLCN